MTNHSGIINIIKIVLIQLLFSFLFFGCSQNLPEINEIHHSVVFSYDDYDSSPKARLSLFMETTTDPRRCERIEIHSLESDYLWNTKKVEKFGTSEKKWSGNVNFVVPEGENIPMGEYEVKYVNADLSEDVSKFTIKYDKRLYSCKSSDVPDIFGESGVLNIAIFDNNHTLLYLGEKTEELSTKGDIFNAYNEAAYYQDVLLNSDRTVICILPENKL